MNAPARLPDARPMVGSIVQAAAVLRHLGGMADGAGVNAIARALGLSPSSCFNVLKTLAAEELVAFDHVSKTYTLGLGTVDLARSALARDPVRSAAQPGMTKLAERFDAAVGLWRLGTRERLTLIALAESAASTRIHMAVGQRQPATAGATGRAVLAARGGGAAAIRAAFAGLRWQQPPDEDTFLAQIVTARRRGWALDIDQTHRGITTVAAALVDRASTVRFCVSASMFTGRDPEERLDEIGGLVCDLAAAVAGAAL